MYIVKLDDLVNKYNSTDHSTIKMKPLDVKPSTYIESSKNITCQRPKSKKGDTVRRYKYKTLFAIGYVSDLV